MCRYLRSVINGACLASTSDVSLEGEQSVHSADPRLEVELVSTALSGWVCLGRTAEGRCVAWMERGASPRASLPLWGRHARLPLRLGVEPGAPTAPLTKAAGLFDWCFLVCVFWGQHRVPTWSPTLLRGSEVPGSFHLTHLGSCRGEGSRWLSRRSCGRGWGIWSTGSAPLPAPAREPNVTSVLRGFSARRLKRHLGFETGSRLPVNILAVV